MEKNTRVLVTGATGFVGSYLLRELLKKGISVRALKRKTSDMALVKDIEAQVEWAEADVTDLGALEDAFEGITHVCHCAAPVSFHPKDAAKMMKIKCGRDKNIVNLA